MPSGISDAYFKKRDTLDQAPRVDWIKCAEKLYPAGLYELLHPRVFVCPICKQQHTVTEIVVKLSVIPTFASVRLDCGHYILFCPGDPTIHGAVVEKEFFNLT